VPQAPQPQAPQPLADREHGERVRRRLALTLGVLVSGYFVSVPVLGLDTDGTHYFDWHQTAADTLVKVDPQELAQGAAAMEVMAYVLADMPEALPHPAPPEPVRP
jgi:hypothetical protein